jgi:hypothetical protein
VQQAGPVDQERPGELAVSPVAPTPANAPSSPAGGAGALPAPTLAATPARASQPWPQGRLCRHRGSTRWVTWQAMVGAQALYRKLSLQEADARCTRAVASGEIEMEQWR